jgi:hypothetical protein
MMLAILLQYIVLFSYQVLLIERETERARESERETSVLSEASLGEYWIISSVDGGG